MTNKNARPSWLIAAGAAGALFAASGAVRAEAPNLLDAPFYASLGTFIVNTDTNLRLDGETQGEFLPGTPVDWEKNFGDGDSTRFRLDGYWRFAERHKVRMMFFNSSTSGSKTIDREIDWNGEVFPVDAKVKGEMSFNIIELAYEYAFMRRDNFELTGTAGLHYVDFSAKLSANVNNGEVTQKVQEDGSVGAPLPVFGGRALWHMGGDFWLDASAQWFALSIDEYDGSLTDLRLAVMWQPMKWAGVGVGYNRFKVDVDVNKDKFNGNLNWTYSGPQIFYSVGF